MSLSILIADAARHARAWRRTAAPQRGLRLGLAAVFCWGWVGACRAQSAAQIPKIVSAKDLGPVKELGDIIKRDGGVAIAFGGVSLWMFDDTLTGKLTKDGIAPGSSDFVTNSASSMPLPLDSRRPDLNRNDTLPSGELQQFIPRSPDEDAYDKAHAKAYCQAGSQCKTHYGIWVRGAAVDPDTGKLYVAFVSFIRGAGVSQRSDQGYGLSVSAGEANGWPVMTRPPQGMNPQRPTLLWSQTDVPFSQSAFVQDGYFYEFGKTETPDPSDPSGHRMDVHQHLARVPLPNILNRAAWQFYSTSGAWTPSQESLADLFVAVSGDITVYYNTYLGEWMAVYLKLGQKAYFRVAATPEGPWSAETSLFQGEAPTARRGIDLDYYLIGHPELSPDGGRTMYFHYSHDIYREGGIDGENLPMEQVVFGRSK